jgi:chromosome segregation ATPase
MSNLEQHIKSVNAKLQQLLKNYAVLQKENETLKQNNKELTEKGKAHQETIDELQQKLSILKASTGQMTDAEKKDFEKRVSTYIKDIDKCITILNE